MYALWGKIHNWHRCFCNQGFSEGIVFAISEVSGLDVYSSLGDNEVTGLEEKKENKEEKTTVFPFLLIEPDIFLVLLLVV